MCIHAYNIVCIVVSAFTSLKWFCVHSLTFLEDHKLTLTYCEQELYQSRDALSILDCQNDSFHFHLYQSIVSLWYMYVAYCYFVRQNMIQPRHPPQDSACVLPQFQALQVVCPAQLKCAHKWRRLGTEASLLCVYVYMKNLSQWGQTSQQSLDSGCFELVNSHQQGIPITCQAHQR